VTGIVAFDEDGFRKDFKLNVLELNLNKPVNKVRCFFTSFRTYLDLYRALSPAQCAAKFCCQHYYSHLCLSSVRNTLLVVNFELTEQSIGAFQSLLFCDIVDNLR